MFFVVAPDAVNTVNRESLRQSPNGNANGGVRGKQVAHVILSKTAKAILKVGWAWVVGGTATALSV
jgi:hypothetical protein